MLRRQPQQILRLAVGEQRPGENAQLPALPDHGAVGIRPLGIGRPVEIQPDGPGDVEVFPGLHGADRFSSCHKAVVSQVQAKGDQFVRIGGGHHILDQTVIRAVLVLEHLLRHLEKLPLEGAGGEVERHIHQISGAPLRGILHVTQSLADDGLNQNTGNIVAHHVPLFLNRSEILFNSL